MTNNQKKPEIYALTGIRALAALWVLLYHLRPELSRAYGNSGWMIDIITSQGYLGVDLFFILSGFIIAYNYSDKFKRITIPSWGEFLWLRFARLYPVHLFILLLLVFSLAGASLLHVRINTPELYSAGTLVKNLLLIQAWSVPFALSWNTPAWSISCEYLAYLVFPLLCTFFAATRGSIRFISVLAFAILFAMAALCQYLNFAGTASYGLFRIAAEFPAGMCLYNLYSRQFGKNWNWTSINLLAFCGIFGGGYALYCFGYRGFWISPLFAILILGMAYGRCVFSRFLSTRPMLIGGYISYSLYMVHEFCILLLRKILPLASLGGRQTEGILTLFAYLIVPIIAAAFCYYVVEEPSRRYLRKIYPKRSRESAVALSPEEPSVP